MTGTFEGLTTLQFTPDNKFCYAYSGNILIASAATVALLEFTTGNEYIEAIITGGRNMKSGAETTTQILFNDQIVFSSKYDNGASLTLVPPYNTNIFMIVPPFTKFVLQATPEDATETLSLIFMGKVGGAIQQQNLESITDDNKWASK